MAEPYLDQDKLVNFLNSHSPVAPGKLSLGLNTSDQPVITQDYVVVLNVVKGEYCARLSLVGSVDVARLWARDMRPFTANELAMAADNDKLDDMFVQLVETHLKQMVVKLGWYIGAGSSLSGVKRVRDRAHIGSVHSLLSVQAYFPGMTGARYSVLAPWVARTEKPVQLVFYLDDTTLDEAWRSSWVGPVQFREFF